MRWVIQAYFIAGMSVPELVRRTGWTRERVEDALRTRSEP